MIGMETPEQACDRARRLVGLSKLARLLNVTPSAVHQWKRVPAERVIDVERATESKVTRYDLRPDLYPK